MNERTKELYEQVKQNAKDYLIHLRKVDGLPLYSEGEYTDLIKKKLRHCYWMDRYDRTGKFNPIDDARSWCEQNFGEEDSSLNQTGRWFGVWNGRDHPYQYMFSFYEEKDLVLFTLRWSGT